MTTWDVGTLPATVSAAESGIAVTGYPALLDDDTSVSLRVLTNADLQRRVMFGGVRRLLLLTAAPSVRDVVKGLSSGGRLAIARRGGDLDELVADCSFAAVDHVLRQHELPWDADAFAELQRIVRREAPGVAAGALVRAADVLAEAAVVRERIGRLDRAGAATVRRRRRGAPRPARAAALRGRGRRDTPRRRRPLRPGHHVPPRPPRRGRRPRPPPDGGGGAAGGRVRRAAAARARRATPPSSSAGASRSSGSACSPSPSAPRAASARPRSAASWPPCAERSSVLRSGPVVHDTTGGRPVPRTLVLARVVGRALEGGGGLDLAPGSRFVSPTSGSWPGCGDTSAGGARRPDFM